ncbi:hypothetical protein ACSQ67_008056 [Phaseolus vulgaris]
MNGHPFPSRGGHRQPPPPPHSANAPNLNFFFQPSPPQYPLNVPNPTTAFFHPPPPSFSFTNTARSFPPQHPPPPPPNSKLAIEHADRAASTACSALLAAGGSVSAWEVSQKALLMLQVDSWNSLGIKMQQVPSLNRLMITEGKVNALVHCFVGVQRITSLYDLEVTICKKECVDNFEALGLGPLLQHPLVIHYFSLRSDVTQVFKITSEEIIQLLSEFLDASRSNEIIKVEEFLDFIAKQRLVKCKEWLGIRITMHISAIREARNSEQSTLKKCLKTLDLKIDNFGKRPLSSSQKKQLDERFNAITQRVECFSPVKKSFCGKHIRFMSSSSEDEDSDSSAHELSNNIMGSQSNPSPQFTRRSDRVSSCPYPSATEEKARLGVRSDMEGHSLVNSSLKNEFCEQPKKKRKFENVTSKRSASFKLQKRNKFGRVVTPIHNGNKTVKTKVPINMEGDLSITNDSLQLFVTTWKEACLQRTVDEVFERMLKFYRVKHGRWRKIRNLFSSYPFIGLLNAAVSSIKSGMRINIYDTLQDIIDSELSNSPTKRSSEYETIDVGPCQENVPVITMDNIENAKCISSGDVIRKIGTYFDHDNEINKISNNSLVQNRITLLRKFCSCGNWVAEQFGIKNFDSLGYGDFISFLEKHINQLPHELMKLFDGDRCENSPFGACMSTKQLTALVSQALSTLWENETVTKQMVSMLLTRQFPSIKFEIVENGSLVNLLDAVQGHKSCVTSKCVVFSATIIGKNYNGESSSDRDNNWSEMMADRSEMSHKTNTKNVIAKNAIEVLLKSPMLSDLSKWSHWDLSYQRWKGDTVRSFCFRGLFPGGRSSRILFPNCSAVTVSDLTCRGEKYVPLSLLKCHACHAFEVMFRNSVEDVEVSDDGNALYQSVEALSKTKILSEISNAKMGTEFSKHLHKVSKVASILSRFVIDCLGYLPAEFHSFASDLLLSGMQSVFKDATSAILCECSNIEQRFMLHEVGLSLGISEWINDYHALISNNTSDIHCTQVSSLKDAKTDINARGHDQYTLDKSPIPEANIEVTGTVDQDKSNQESNACCRGNSFQNGADMDASLLIESIRRDEFGLDSNLSDIDTSMLKKQHARLGRALHCLSQELYSQDSHFILELVQNADDNNYPENVEPTLTFILQDSGIVVLNNERGFSAQNMRALCDVGNSTKKGSNAGYIGKKGIGFKSVFRVTDAPEIHSNGFHVKFDISEGQIGFVLPTVIPPCDIGILRRMAFTDTELYDDSPWNTCILLPFRSRLSEGMALNNILTMFSDLHPSLLLFLHRLKCMKLRNMLNDTLIVMKKEILGDGIIKVSHGKEKMVWFVVSQKLQTNSIRFDVKTTEISMAFTLQESDNSYIPCSDQQPVFAFLPLRTYGLKFILQGDFVLPSSREEVDGDSPWNQWLLSEYPSLFVRALREFCELPCFRSEPGKGLSAFMSFVPLVGEVHGFSPVFLV